MHICTAALGAEYGILQHIYITNLLNIFDLHLDLNRVILPHD